MKSIGLLISHKENEKRRALVPEDIKLLKHPELIFIEDGYGQVLGFSNDDYSKFGIKVCDRTEVLTKDVICDPKIGDADYLNSLYDQTIFGWVHAVQNRDITDKIIESKLSSYAWEDMFEDGRHCFWRNNEIAGEAAVFHAYMCHGVFPYHTKAAVLGKGNIARGAIKTLNYLGADVVQYDRKTERLFQKELGEYDVIVNAILWDTSRKDHIVYREDLKRMRPGSLIIDIACDRCGGIETSVPTTIENPVYYIDGIAHYVVDHTPSLFWKTTSESLSSVFVKYVDYFIEGKTYENETLLKCQNFDKGRILDERINKYQNR